MKYQISKQWKIHCWLVLLGVAPLAPGQHLTQHSLFHKVQKWQSLVWFLAKGGVIEKRKLKSWAGLGHYRLRIRGCCRNTAYGGKMDLDWVSNPTLFSDCVWVNVSYLMGKVKLPASSYIAHAQKLPKTCGFASSWHHRRCHKDNTLNTSSSS